MPLYCHLWDRLHWSAWRGQRAHHIFLTALSCWATSASCLLPVVNSSKKTLLKKTGQNFCLLLGMYIEKLEVESIFLCPAPACPAADQSCGVTMQVTTKRRVSSDTAMTTWTPSTVRPTGRSPPPLGGTGPLSVPCPTGASAALLACVCPCSPACLCLLLQPCLPVSALAALLAQCLRLQPCLPVSVAALSCRCSALKDRHACCMFAMCLCVFGVKPPKPKTCIDLRHNWITSHSQTGYCSTGPLACTALLCHACHGPCFASCSMLCCSTLTCAASVSIGGNSSIHLTLEHPQQL